MISRNLLKMLKDGFYQDDTASYINIVWTCANIISECPHLKVVLRDEGMYIDILRLYVKHQDDGEAKDVLAWFIANTFHHQLDWPRKTVS